MNSNRDREQEFKQADFANMCVDIGFRPALTLRRHSAA
jgi:hypothetical protein